MKMDDYVRWSRYPFRIRQSAVQETAGILQGLSPEIIREVAEGDEFSVIT